MSFFASSDENNMIVWAFEDFVRGAARSLGKEYTAGQCIIQERNGIMQIETQQEISETLEPLIYNNTKFEMTVDNGTNPY